MRSLTPFEVIVNSLDAGETYGWTPDEQASDILQSLAALRYSIVQR